MPKIPIELDESFKWADFPAWFRWMSWISTFIIVGIFVFAFVLVIMGEGHDTSPPPSTTEGCP